MNSLQRYQEIFLEKGIEMNLLGKGMEDINRMVNILIAIDSEYIFPTDNSQKLHQYAKKMIDNGYNFILSDGDSDIGVISLYANDFVTRTAYTSTIGVCPSHRKGPFGRTMAKFGIDFLKELGMKKVKAEVHKSNAIWLRYLQRLEFQIESEKEDGTYIIVRDL